MTRDPDRLLADRRTRDQLRQANRAWGRGLSGRSGLAAPMDRTRTSGRPQPSVTITPAVGETVRLSGTTDVGPEGAHLSWDGLDGPFVSAGFDRVGLPTDEVEVGVYGYFDLHLDLRWDDGFRGGGTVAVELRGEVLEEFVSAGGAGGRVTVPLGLLDVGDVVKVWVSPDA